MREEKPKFHQMALLSEGHNSIAYYTLAGPENLVIFVHGFGGQAVKSWNDFTRAIKGDPAYKYSDIIFYGYESRRLPLIGSAELFYRHLKKFVKKGYSHIILVAHSMGAIVVRRTLLNAKRDDPQWLSRCRFVLFAPAHRGAIQQKLVFEFLPRQLKLFAAMARLKYISLNDLDEESTTIKDLIADTGRYLQDPKNDNFTKARHIVAAVNDRVVIKGHFCDDPNPEPVEDKGHVSVCKPILGTYLIPLEAVKKGFDDE